VVRLLFLLSLFILRQLLFFLIFVYDVCCFHVCLFYVVSCLLFMINTLFVGGVTSVFCWLCFNVFSLFLRLMPAACHSKFVVYGMLGVACCLSNVECCLFCEN